MIEPTPHLSRELPSETRDYLAHRLDGARDLYLLALALGDRPEGSALFGRMIREARIHFAAVIEEARIAGLHEPNAIEPGSTAVRTTIPLAWSPFWSDWSCSR